MAVLELKGDIISNEYKWVYDWLEWDSTCPNDAKNAIKAMQEGEQLEVLVNSYGGDVKAGQEIYSLLNGVKTSVAVIQSFAASAAGVAAMGCHTVRMSPVGVIMIHNVSCGGVSGDYHEMDKASHMLRTLNSAMANAYAAKSGRPLDEILRIMDRETWLTAERAMEYGFIDEIIQPKQPAFTNAFEGMRLTQDVFQRVKAEKENLESRKKLKEELTGDLYAYGT